VLVCGLNPSIYAAEHGMPFGRPGNRFWPAALKARLVDRDRDLAAALERGVGFTDLVKRPTVRAAELTRDEYEAGVDRIRSLVRAFRPKVLCFVGLEGWRRAVDRNATPGWVRGGFEGADAYLMPSTSGLNAHARLDDLVKHLRCVQSRACPS
jgi:TDG/mug DNA glycosylase family protein